MCGIFGYFNPDGIDQSYCCQLLDKLSHRGPDASGNWVSADRSLYLGHRRLKIIDLSNSANQPMISPDGRYILVYNGEIYNYRSLRTKVKNWEFKTSSDTEVLLAILSEHNHSLFDECCGMFAFAVFDTLLETLTLVRDRFGIKPLYYTKLPNNGYAFASEIIALLPLMEKISPDKDLVRSYLESGLYEVEGRTFFSGINSIKPGSKVVVDLKNNTLQEFKWYELHERILDYSSTDFSDLVEEGEKIIVKAIQEHLIADVAVGLNVSGGVDSSLLVSVAKRSISDIHLFSQDYETPYSEAMWVKEIADDCRLHLLKLTEKDIRQRFDFTVGLQAEPFGGVTVIGYDYLYNHASSEGITVLLDGNGVDEVFQGYSKYYQRSETGTFSSIDGSIGLRPVAVSDHLKKEASLLSVPDFNSRFDDPVKAMAALDLLVYKIPRGLRFNDRMSMAHSRELRVPFLDHRVVEFGFAVPSRYLLTASLTKALFRSIARRWIPENVAYASKRSVQSPQREWLAGVWQDIVTEVIYSDSFADRGWVDPQMAKSLYSEYIKGSKENSLYVWQWVNLELWARKFIDNQVR